jgi:hypothetical protein
MRTPHVASVAVTLLCRHRAEAVTDNAQVNLQKLKFELHIFFFSFLVTLEFELAMLHRYSTT